jgi:hypothetical protein
MQKDSGSFFLRLPANEIRAYDRRMENTDNIFTWADDDWQPQRSRGTTLLREAAYKADVHRAKFLDDRRMTRSGWKSRYEMRNV